MSKDQAVATESATKAAKKPRVAKQGAAGAPKKDKTPKQAKTPKAPKERKQRTDTKAAQVLALLKRKNGATMQQIMAATEWQPHTVRGFLAGTLRKKHGLTVTSSKQEGGARSYFVEG